MRMIKVGDQYLGLVDRQADAIRFDGETKASVIALREAGVRTGDLPQSWPRTVKLTTLADRTAESMRGLAQDVEGDK